MDKSKYPLSGIRVLDFGWVAAGPSATKILADMGAEVIKVESRKRPDTTRFTPDNIERSPETDPAFHSLNRNKLGITIDMTKPEGCELLRKLAAKTDIVLENFFPGVMKKFGLDYESLRKVKPDIIMVSMPGLGNWGPQAETPSYAPGLAALSGLESMVGYKGERALGLQQPYSDYNAGTNSAFAALAALIHRNRTGEGQNIEVAQIEALVACIGEAVLDYQVTGKVPGLEGNRHGRMAPYNNYLCDGDDKWVSIAVRTDEEWKNLVEVMADEPRLKNEKFAAMDGRMANQDELDVVISDWTISRSAEEITEMLQEKGVAAFPCMDIGDCFLDPHFQDREVFIPLEHPVSGDEFIANLSWKMSETNGGVYRSAPLWGQHNHYVFGEVLGLSQEEIARLEDAEVIQKFQEPERKNKG
ncbi:MAG: CoA transferase [Deltaproteobacteria bacterium]|nr:CoA transferase [Deltaproteobacteria bacterium]